MKSSEEKRWERLNHVLLAESQADSPVRISSQRTLFGIKSYAEEVIERTAAEEDARLKADIERKKAQRRARTESTDTENRNGEA